MSASVGGGGAGAPNVTNPDSATGSADGEGMALEGSGVGGPTTGSGIAGEDEDGGGVYIGGAAGVPPVSPPGAPQANDLNSSEPGSPAVVPWNGAGVSGLAPSVSSTRSTSRASRRQRGPSSESRISSKSSQASCAFWVRSVGSLTSSCSIQSETRWSTSGRMLLTGAIGSLT